MPIPLALSKIGKSSSRRLVSTCNGSSLISNVCVSRYLGICCPSSNPFPDVVFADTTVTFELITDLVPNGDDVVPTTTDFTL